MCVYILSLLLLLLLLLLLFLLLLYVIIIIAIVMLQDNVMCCRQYSEVLRSICVKHAEVLKRMLLVLPHVEPFKKRLLLIQCQSTIVQVSHYEATSAKTWESNLNCEKTSLNNLVRWNQSVNIHKHEWVLNIQYFHSSHTLHVIIMLYSSLLTLFLSVLVSLLLQIDKER